MVFYGCGDLSMVLDQFSLFLMLQGSCDPVLPHSPKKFEIRALGNFLHRVRLSCENFSYFV